MTAASAQIDSNRTRNEERNTLCLFPALPARREKNDAFGLTQKFVDGVAAYADRWPGRVKVALRETTVADTNLDHCEVSASDESFDLVWRDEHDLDQMIRESSIALVSLIDEHVSIVKRCNELGTPCVLVTEQSRRTRDQIIDAETNNPLLRMRRHWWNRGLESRYEYAVRTADGVQCNGLPTYNAYRSINDDAMLYFDTRTTADMVIEDEMLQKRVAPLKNNESLRLAFSGRLVAIKGVDDLPRVAAALRDRDVEFTLDIFGGGEPAFKQKMQSEIKKLNLSNYMRLRGVLDFATELMPEMRNNVDLFVCCHRQGDPACTYLETMACGVPIVGYDNEALAGLVEHSGVGWTSPMNDPAALAHRIADLAAQREKIAVASHDSVEFARQHTFEETMQSRVDHLQSCVTTAGAAR